MPSKSQAKPEAATAEPGTAIVDIQERMRSRLANVNKTTAAPANKKISTKGGLFTLPDGKASKGPVNCIVLDYLNNYSYYAGDYDPNNVVPPDCFSVGREIENLVPHESIENPQCETCAECEMNKFGSSGRGKACKNQVILAIIPEGFNDESEVLTIKISPTALKGWSSYVRTLAEGGHDVAQVITSIAFREGVQYPTLTFRQIGMNERMGEIGRFLPEADTALNATAGV